MERAIAHFTEALTIPEDSPNRRDSAAWTHHFLGWCYLERRQGDASENSDMAIKHLRAALVYNPRDYPLEWAQVHDMLDSAYRECARGDGRANKRRARYHAQQAMLSLPTAAAQGDAWAQGMLVTITTQAKSSNRTTVPQ